MKRRNRNMVGAVILLCSWMGISPDAYAQLPDFINWGTPAPSGKLCGLEVKAFVGQFDPTCPNGNMVLSGCSTTIVGNELAINVSINDDATGFGTATASACHRIHWNLSQGSKILSFSGASFVAHKSSVNPQSLEGVEVCASTDSVMSGSNKWKGDVNMLFDFAVSDHATVSINDFRLTDQSIVGVAGAVVLRFSWEIREDDGHVLRRGVITHDGTGTFPSTKFDTTLDPEFDLLANVTYTFYAEYDITPTNPISTSVFQTGPNGISDVDCDPVSCAFDPNTCTGEGDVDAWSVELEITGPGADCDGLGGPDPAQIAADPSLDCNRNNILDSCEIAASAEVDGRGDHDSDPPPKARLLDLNENGILDECEETDCNDNGLEGSECSAAGVFLSDIQETFFGCTADCNLNFIPDECDISSGASEDINLDGVPDECQCISDIGPDCPSEEGYGDNQVDILDYFILIENWGACPTPCPSDINSDGTVNVTDMLILLGDFGSCNGTILNPCSPLSSLCTAPSEFCQDQGLPSFEPAPGAPSDRWADSSTGEEQWIRHADDFIATDGGVNQICWWGVYKKGSASCHDDVNDNFTITIYDSTAQGINGIPDENTVIKCYVQTPAAGCETIPSASFERFGPVDRISSYWVFQYTVNLPVDLNLIVGHRYWIEIKNETNSGAPTNACLWLWSWSEGIDPLNNNDLGQAEYSARSKLFVGNYAGSDTRNDDLAFCLNFIP